MNFADHLRRLSALQGQTLTVEQIEQFTVYYELLIEWNSRMNLTAITEPRDVALKHMVDSMTCNDPAVIKPGAHLADIGTGAGFPGIPLKIVRPDLRISLIDSLNKRLSFLQEVISRLDLQDVSLWHSRAEDAARQRQHRERYDVVTARAVSRLSVLAEWTLPFAAVGGYVLAMKGPQVADEITAGSRAVGVLGGKVERTREFVLAESDETRIIVYIKKERPTSALYPRKAGVAEKKPL